MQSFTLHALGELRLDGAQRALGSPRKALALLTYLARRSARRCRREELMALFWGDRPESRARQSLRQVLLELRQLLGEALEVGPDQVTLMGAGVELDASEFERDVANGHYQQAVERWHGDFLADAEDVGGEHYRVWIEEEREALRRKLAFALERLVEQAESTEAWMEAVRWADAWTHALPYDEHAHCRLVHALDRAGKREEAHARHGAFLVRLRRDVDLEPSTELLRLGERLSRPPATDHVARPNASTWTPLGTVQCIDALAGAWNAARAGESRLVLLGGSDAATRMQLIDKFHQRIDAPGALVLLKAHGRSEQARGMAKELLAGLRRAPGLSGAPDAALAELSALVPEIRERFQKLPAASGKADALEPAVAQVLADVTAESGIIICVDDAAAADTESRVLLAGLIRRHLPGVLILLSDEIERIDASDIRNFATHALRLNLQTMTPLPSATVAPRGLQFRAAVWPALRGSRRLRVLAAMPLVIAAAFALLAPHGRPTVPDRLAVLPFTLHGPERYDYLRDGLAEMLSTSLDGVVSLRTVDAHSVLRQAMSVEGVLDPQRASALAQKLGADLFVLGSITESGRMLRVQATLYRGSDERPLVRATAEGGTENVFRLVDELAEQILSHIDAGPGARFSRIAAMTTDSLDALKAYLDGASLLRRFLVRDAFDAFHRAVTIDSTFALAWHGQATAASWMLAPELASAAAENAVRHAGRLSQRDRALVEMFRAFLAGHADDAERLSRIVLANYPDDVERRMQLAEVLFHFSWRRGRSLTEAEAELRRVLRSEPDYTPAMVHLAQIALHRGRNVEADTLTQRLMAAYGEGPTAAWMGALQAVATGDDRALISRLDELYDSGDWWLTLAMWNLATFAPDMAPADRAALRLVDAGRTRSARAIGHLARAHLELARGRWQNAQAELAQLEPLNPEWFMEYRALLSAAWFLPNVPDQYQAARKQLLHWHADAIRPSARSLELRPWTTIHDHAHGDIRLYLLGLMSLRLGDFKSATRQVMLLDSLTATKPGPLLGRGLAGGLRAQMLRLQGRPADALALLEATTLEAPFEYAMTSSFWSQALERYLRAELLAELGRYDEALGILGTFGETSILDAIYRAPAELKAAEIAEHRGEPASAVVHYRRFIQLWHDCDPELRPLVVEAQRRIERLR